MKYWIIAVPRERLKACIKLGVFGLTRKFVLGHMEPGDKLVCYVTKERKLAALGEVTAPYYIDDTDIFNDPKVYIDRIKMKAEWLPKEAELDFMDVLPHMKFVKNPLNWQAHFNGGAVEIKESDWNYIEKEAKAKALLGSKK